MPVAAGVAEGMGVSSAPSNSDGNWKASAQKPIRNGRDRLRRCCFIRTFDQLASVISFSRTPLKAVMNKEKPFTLHKMTDLFVSSAIWQARIGRLHNDKCFYRLVLGCGGRFSGCKLGDTIGACGPADTPSRCGACR